jgi:hypothetical protein
LLVGDTNGNVQIYLNTNNNANPVLGEGVFIQANMTNINVGERATSVADDWNGDGQKDLIIGNMEGNVVIYLNKGTDSLPTFDSPFLLQVDGEVFDAGTRSAPRIYDWNKDGMKDLLVGEMEGYVYYLKNVGTRNAPLFKKAEKLVLRNGDFLRYPDPTGNPRSRLFVTDWNDDGLDDILLSGRDGKVMLFLATSDKLYSPLVFGNGMWNQSIESFVKLKNKSIGKIREMKKRLLNILF